MYRFLFSVIVAALMVSPVFSAEKNVSDPELFKPQRKKYDFTGMFPSNVKTIAVVTPASCPNAKAVKSGVRLLRKAGYKVKVYPNVQTRQKDGKTGRYLACPLELRVKDFEAAWRDMENDFIICSRGGRGTVDLVESVNWAALPKRPELYVMGYSDVTMLLGALSVKGYGHPVAGPNLSSFFGLDQAMIPEIKKMFNGEELAPMKLKTLVPGDCSGKAMAGLLSRFSLMCTKNYGLQTRGRILFIENVNTTVAQAREHLNILWENKFFDGAAGVVFCHFVRSGSQEEFDRMLREFAPALKIPVYLGYPFGHQSRLMAIDYAREAVIKDGIIYFPATAKTK